MKGYFLVFLRGLMMGAADIVPGVSSATIALITGIYERLIAAINAIDIEAGKLIFNFKIKELWKKIDGWFLVCLAIGISTSMISLAQLIALLLSDFPLLIWSFFFGLVLASTALVLVDVNKKSIKSWGFFLFFAVVSFFLCSSSALNTPDGMLFVLLTGMIAICAMILPGISGSFILVLLGKYTFMLNNVNQRNLPVIVVFGIGCILGLMAFSRVVSWALENFKNVTFASLAGFMLGSLVKLWPWKLATCFRQSSHGGIKIVNYVNVLPVNYKLSIYNGSVVNFEPENIIYHATDNLLLSCIGSMIIGLFIVYFIRKLKTD